MAPDDWSRRSSPGPSPSWRPIGTPCSPPPTGGDGSSPPTAPPAAAHGAATICCQRSSFCPGRRASRRTRPSGCSARTSSSTWTSATEGRSTIRSVLARSSPTVWGPRNRSAARRPDRAASSPWTSSRTCRYRLTERPWDGSTTRTRCSARSSSMAATTSSSPRSTTGSRLVAWFAAVVNAFRVSGYCWGVVSCFSTRHPRTRPASGVSGTPGQYRFDPARSRRGRRNPSGFKVVGITADTPVEHEEIGGGLTWMN